MAHSLNIAVRSLSQTQNLIPCCGGGGGGDFPAELSSVEK